MAGDPMAAEFGTVAEWTAQVASQLGPAYAIPAGCRGSGRPAALEWLLAGLAGHASGRSSSTLSIPRAVRRPGCSACPSSRRT